MTSDKRAKFVQLNYDAELHGHLPMSRQQLIKNGGAWHSEDHIVIERLTYVSLAKSKRSLLWWLSVRRKDNGKMGWAEKQEVKNSFCGEQHEGFEVFPPQSEVTDTSNQYHLWVFKDPTQRLGVQLYQ